MNALLAQKFVLQQVIADVSLCKLRCLCETQFTEKLHTPRLTSNMFSVNAINGFILLNYGATQKCDGESHELRAIGAIGARQLCNFGEK